MSRTFKLLSTLAVILTVIATAIAARAAPDRKTFAKEMDALARAEAQYPPGDARIATALLTLANATVDRGNAADAEPLLMRALQIRAKSLGLAHPDVREVIATLSRAYTAMGRYEEAQLFFRIALQTFSLADSSQASAEATVRNASIFIRNGRDTDPKMRNLAFEAAQRSLNSDAAKALMRMAERAVTDSATGSLVRQYQDLANEHRELLAHLLSDLQQDAAPRDLSEVLKRHLAINDRTGEIWRTVTTKIPNYTLLVDSTPDPTADVQKHLAENEALVLYLDTSRRHPPGETFVFVVTANQSRWARVGAENDRLHADIDALRCGLDATLWHDATTWAHATEEQTRLRTVQMARRQRCQTLIGQTSGSDRIGLASFQHLPFDTARAHQLYKALFDPIEDLIKDKHLLIVASGPLTQLPFHVLVTEAPASAMPLTVAGYRDVAWLARKHAITVLPAVSSLKALREFAKASRATEPFIGFGDPLLNGDPARFQSDAEDAKRAREAKCPADAPRVAAIDERRDAARGSVRSNAGLADVADLLTWAPLPDTADELCAVAQKLGVDPAAHLYLGGKATETEIKQLSESGALARYRMVHFATHGAVAGELSGTAEPGLILTPPAAEKANQTDDGYLSASEIAALKLDADWVILSACNTAAGDAAQADALSGLARAFFYAGARSLLVSHWEVASDATVSLIIKAVAELTADPKIGRSEALRRSMLAMITGGKDYEAHPAFWAPFVVVGEGAR
jgi:CHAT domain-containing protein